MADNGPHHRRLLIMMAMAPSSTIQRFILIYNNVGGANKQHQKVAARSVRIKY